MFIKIVDKPKTKTEIELEIQQKSKRTIFSAFETDFEHFIVLDEYWKKEERQRRKFYKCLCNCGIEFHIRSDGIHDRVACSNGCKLLRTYGSKHHNWKGVGDLSSQYFSDIKAGAKRRKILFDISIEDMWTQFEKQNSECALSSIMLTLSSSRSDVEQTASLDRINSKKGYEINNIQWIHKVVQRMKWDFDEGAFKRICFMILNPVVDEYNSMLDFNSKDYRWRGCGAISGQIFQKIKHSAKNRNIEFKINVNDCWNLFVKQRGKCFYTGQNLFLGTTKLTVGDTTASLDRIKSNVGYVNDNIQWVHKDVNKVKYQLTSTDLVDWCSLIV